MIAKIILLFLISAVYCNDYYYVYARQWPPTTCLKTTCNFMENFNGNNLNIHGLWLNYGTAESCGYPSNCLNIPFDASSLSTSTNTSLKSNWVGVFSSSDTFHNHQWTKHGTCYQKDITGLQEILSKQRRLQLQKDVHQDAYFSLACNLNQQYNIIATLKSKGIVPSKTKGYSLADLYRAIGTSASNSLITCTVINSTYYLMAYYTCLDKSWNIINCPCKLAPLSGQVACSTSFQVFIPPL